MNIRNFLLPTCLLLLLSIAATPSTKPAGMTFTYEGDPTKWDQNAYERITKAMTEAVAIYNQHGTWKQSIPVLWSPGTPTADANYNARIRFGGQIGTRTALHEISHVLGVGTHPQWRSMIKDGKWTGPRAIAQLKEFDGPDAVLHADRQHFWPYGLNFDKEGSSPEQVRRHVLIVKAFRADLGIFDPPSKKK